jgi:UDP-N-acetylglucosamine diphosphorylase/glucosamine-1-phosphate N-acetyltransferase
MNKNINKIIVIILAGGLGKRMNSEIPKVLHLILLKPMLVHVIEQARLNNPEKILIVVGKYKEIIINVLKQYTSIADLEFIYQPDPLGTGHAIQCCKPYLLDNCFNLESKKVIILSGDVPLIQYSTISNLVDACRDVSIVTTELAEPKGYGRIIETNGCFSKIVEEKDCSKEEKDITKVNCGIYALTLSLLCKHIDKLTNNNSQKEYYLTDIIETIKKEEGVSIDMYNIDKEKQHEIMGVNTEEQLKELANIYGV